MRNTTVWIALLACPVTCYFTACYLALKTFNRKRLEELLELRGQSERYAPFIARLEKLQLMTGTLRVVVNMVVVLALLMHMQLRYPPPEMALWLQYIIALLLAGLLVSVFGVAIPTSWSRYRAEPLLAASTPLLHACLALFMPFVNFLHLADPLIRRLTGVTDNSRADEQLSEELISVVEEHDPKVDPQQRQMIEAVVEFRTTTVGQIMTPRTDVVGLEATAGLDEVKRAVIERGHSRLPVYSDNLDNILGILYARDLIALLGTDQPLNLRQTLREALMVPESKPVKELLAEFKARKVHIAIVLDEYGGTAGLVTIEDILEEIVGDIEDEYEKKQRRPPIRRIDPRTWDVEARMRIDDLNDELGLSLPENEDYDTVGGFVLARLGHIPQAGEAFTEGEVRVTVTEAQRTKVLTVRLQMLEQAS